MTLDELVNELFEPWKQVDESQYSLLAVALQTVAGGIYSLTMPHGTNESVLLMVNSCNVFTEDGNRVNVERGAGFEALKRLDRL